VFADGRDEGCAIGARGFIEFALGKQQTSVFSNHESARRISRIDRKSMRWLARATATNPTHSRSNRKKPARAIARVWKGCRGEF